MASLPNYGLPIYAESPHIWGDSPYMGMHVGSNIFSGGNAPPHKGASPPYGGMPPNMGISPHSMGVQC
jgi:hypothetical protein